MMNTKAVFVVFVLGFGSFLCLFSVRGADDEASPDEDSIVGSVGEALSKSAKQADESTTDPIMTGRSDTEADKSGVTDAASTEKLGPEDNFLLQTEEASRSMLGSVAETSGVHAQFKVLSQEEQAVEEARARENEYFADSTQLELQN